jgi:two-component system, OmpR family, response regulator
MSQTILVVDDDVDYQSALRVQLENAGYQVVIADSLSDGLSTLAKLRPDLAIVDLMLEHMDGGFTLCYQIKSVDEKIPVILVTGVHSRTGIEFDAATDEERSWIKADVMLEKPVRFEHLASEIRRLLPQG